MTRIGLFSSAKNEGPFLLEWVAYHLLSGFGPIVVFSNDSTDGTTELLDAFDQNGILHHVLQDLQPGQVPQYQAADQGYKHPAFADADWLMWIDSDEFLYCANSANSVQELVTGLDGEQADGMAVNWLNFGDSGHPGWQPGPVTQRFLMRGANDNSRHCMFKTLFRKSDKVRSFGLHRPFLHGDFQESGRHIVNSAGQPMHANMYRAGGPKRHALGAAPDELIAHEKAAIFHYAVKTRDSFELKRKRGQGTKSPDADNRASRFREAYWNVYNQNLVEDRRMLDMGPRLQAKMDELLAIPEIAAAHASAEERYRSALETRNS